MKASKEEISLAVKQNLTGAALILIGLFLMIFPSVSLTTVCVILGIFVLAKGIVKLIEYLRLRKADMQYTGLLMSVIANFSLALFLLVHPRPILSIIPAIIGIAVVIYGVTTLTSSHSRGKSKVLAVIEIIIGGLIVISPFALAEFMTAILGIALIAFGVITIVAYFYGKKHEHDPKVDENGYKEIEFKDVDDN